MLNLQPMSEKQLDVVEHARTDYTLCLAHGAFRSGKTIAADLGFALWLLDQGQGYDHAICGLSLETIMRNVGFDLIEIFEKLGFNARVDRQWGTRIIVEGDKVPETTIWLINAGDERSQKRLQGSTLKGLYIDEVVILPESLFVLAWSRLSVKGSKAWATYNPDNPNHWFKKTVVDRAEDYDAVEIKFLLRDNPSLDEEVIQRYENSFRGHWYKRYVLGEWAGASGLIYADWYPASDQDYKDVEGGYYVGSLDWASATVFHALLYKVTPTKTVVCSELRYDARDDQRARTDQEHLDAMLKWLASFDIRTLRVYVDPNTPAAFKRIMREAGLDAVNADNDVLEGISTTINRLAEKNIVIDTEECPYLTEELHGYVWDEKKQNVGIDAPLKENDHGCDNVRYYAHSTRFGMATSYVTTKEVGF